jgi:hypothetical protein
MTNELKQECGAGYYWCTTDKVCKPMQKEDGEGGMVGGSPVINSASRGEIAGLGFGKDGEPGIKKNKKGVKSFTSFIKRKSNVAS